VFFIAGASDESGNEVVETRASVVDEVSEDDGGFGVDALQRDLELVLAGVELKLSLDGWTVAVGGPFDNLTKNVGMVFRSPPLAFVVDEEIAHGVTSP
jgi:hypothetical protein